MVVTTRFKALLTRQQLCFVFFVEAALIPLVNTSTNEKANRQSELASHTINPEVVCRDDDAQQRCGGVQQYQGTNPAASGKWPHGKCAPT